MTTTTRGRAHPHKWGPGLLLGWFPCTMKNEDRKIHSEERRYVGCALPTKMLTPFQSFCGNTHRFCGNTHR